MRAAEPPKATARFKDIAEALMAFSLPAGAPGRISFHDPISVRLPQFTEPVEDQKTPAKPMPASGSGPVEKACGARFSRMRASV